MPNILCIQVNELKGRMEVNNQIDEKIKSMELFNTNLKAYDETLQVVMNNVFFVEFYICLPDQVPWEWFYNFAFISYPLHRGKHKCWFCQNTTQLLKYLKCLRCFQTIFVQINFVKMFCEDNKSLVHGILQCYVESLPNLQNAM